MKRYEALLAAALVLPFGGCIKRVCAILPVPPADSRSRMYDLPLDKQDDLVADLTAGLNPNNRKDHVAVDANARKSYAPLLARLGSAERPTAAELKTPEFRKLLHGQFIAQVVDSRDDFAPKDLETPIAVSDGRYYWVFYPGADGRMKSVMAVKMNACQQLEEKKR